MGNKFVLATDHKPLIALFGEKRGIPQMAAGRLQRWALFLSGFDYTIQYVRGKENEGADGLSRLPIEEKDDSKIKNDFDYFHFLAEDKIPLDAEKIKSGIRTDTLLSKVYLYVKNGWPNIIADELKPYYSRATEISIDNGILMWGYRVLIPEKYRKQLLDELHGTHQGMVKMKTLARQYLWWPNLDKEIERVVKDCN